MTGHRHWAYTLPGTTGQACSDPEFISGPSFYFELERLAHEDDEFKAKDDSQNNVKLVTDALGELSEAVKAACIESAGKNPSDSAEVSWLNYMENSWDKTTPPSIRYFSTIQVFCNLFDVSWFVVG